MRFMFTKNFSSFYLLFSIHYLFVFIYEKNFFTFYNLFSTFELLTIAVKILMISMQSFTIASSL